MSWDSYVDNIIAHGQGNVDKAAILGLDGSNWTPCNTGNQSKVLNIAADEGKCLTQVLQSNDFQSFQANGCKLETVKYQFLRDAAGVLIFKKKGNGGLSVAKTQKALVIGHYPEGKSAELCNLAVAKVSDYLKSIQF